MQNAHLRFGRLDYRRNSGKTDTRISVHVDRYVGEGEDAHLISVFGGDAEVGAITAAIHERHTFTIAFLVRMRSVTAAQSTYEGGSKLFGI
jgi:hypothetical protein